MSHIELLFVVIVSSDPLPQVVLIVTLIPMSSISPEIFTMSMHLSILELTFIVGPIFEFHNTLTLYLIVVIFPEELPLISDSISKIDCNLNIL